MLVAALVIAACGGGNDDSGSGEEGGATSRLIVGTDSEPSTLDAHGADENGVTLATWSINEALVDLDPEGVMEPVLAAEIPVVDDADETRWHVKLREGITFSDGTPFDAEAVKFNVERIVDPDYASPHAELMGSLSGAEVIDELTVDLLTSAPDSSLLDRLRRLRMVSPTAAAQDDYGDNPVGTGSYVFDSWQRGEILTLKSNADYWGDTKPSIDEIEIRFIPDANTRLSALLAGEISVAVNPPDSQIDQLRETDGIQIVTGTGGESGATRISTINAPYSDPKFRQALNYAINKEEMVEHLFNDIYPVQNCNMVPPGSRGHNEDLEAYPYDPDKARQLLSEVDIPGGFKVQFVGPVNVIGSDREIVEAISSYWREVGLDVDSSSVELDPWLDAVYDPEVPVVYVESDNEYNSFAKQISAYLHDDGAQNALSPEDQAELDPLIETALSSFDDDAVEEAMHEIAEIVCDEAYMVFNWFRQDIVAMADNVEYVPDLGDFEKTDWNRMRVGR